jgi:hypothetical protein
VNFRLATVDVRDAGEFPAGFLVLPIATFPFREHILGHVNYRMERAFFVRREASGNEGSASALENIGQSCQVEIDG